MAPKKIGNDYSNLSWKGGRRADVKRDYGRENRNFVLAGFAKFGIESACFESKSFRCVFLRGMMIIGLF